MSQFQLNNLSSKLGGRVPVKVYTLDNNSKTFLISSQNEEIVKPHIKKKKKNRSYKVEEN